MNQVLFRGCWTEWGSQPTCGIEGIEKNTRRPVARAQYEPPVTPPVGGERELVRRIHSALVDIEPTRDVSLGLGAGIEMLDDAFFCEPVVLLPGDFLKDVPELSEVARNWHARRNFHAPNRGRGGPWSLGLRLFELFLGSQKQGSPSGVGSKLLSG